MKKTSLIFALTMLLTTAFYAQVTTIVNYDFNSASSYPVQPITTASNIICSGSSSETFQTFTGASTGSGAFVQNTTAGNAIAMSNSSGSNTRYFLFQLGGADLSSYQSYKLYFQPQRSSTGANLITVAYSTDGSSYTNFSTTYAVTTSFSDMSVDLSSITSLNNVSAVYIKLLVSGATATTGTIRMDNFQVQANKAGSGAGGNPWQVSGGNVNFIGNVGIGTASPVAPLDVNGNANINGNLTTSTSKNITAGGNIIGNSNLTIAGTSTFNGLIQATQGLNLNSASGFKLVSGGGSSGTITYGKTPGGLITFPTPCAAQPQTYLNHAFGGNVQIFDTDASGNYITGSGLLNLQTWSGGSSIDASIGGNTGGGGLLLNYFCGNNTIINAGTNGGTVIMGNKVTAAQSVKIGNDGTGNVDPNTALTIHQNATNTFGVKIKTYNNGLSAFSIDNSNYTNSPFIVYGNGNTRIGGKTSAAHPAAELQVYGTIVSREIYVTKQSDWPDYVFEPNYKLQPLNEVEAFYKQNKHLPSVPSERELTKTDINVAEMNAILLKKIEELTLYAVEQNKQLIELKKEVQTLKNK